MQFETSGDYNEYERSGEDTGIEGSEAATADDYKNYNQALDSSDADYGSVVLVCGMIRLMHGCISYIV